MGKNICCIFSVAPYYRAPIFNLMDKNLNCDFFLGDKMSTPILMMNYNDLNGFKEELNNEMV